MTRRRNKVEIFLKNLLTYTLTVVIIKVEKYNERLIYMKGFTVIGKRKTSTDSLKKSLYNLLDYEPTIISDESNDLNFKCHFYINPKNGYNLIDFIYILKYHCSEFKLEIDDDMYYESISSSPYFNVTEYYYWDGKDLKKCYKDYFGSTCVFVNYLIK